MMKKVNNRQYKLAQIRTKRVFIQDNTKTKLGRRRTARLDRRGGW